ncbi:hypothetical protein BTVI_68834 [Pitangus sulphuratus]|nr:hypothetical protein BTVI_68834 [Pitangus sulphuratus]
MEDPVFTNISENVNDTNVCEVSDSEEDKGGNLYYHVRKDSASPPSVTNIPENMDGSQENSEDSCSNSVVSQRGDDGEDDSSLHHGAGENDSSSQHAADGEDDSSSHHGSGEDGSSSQHGADEEDDSSSHHGAGEDHPYQQMDLMSPALEENHVEVMMFESDLHSPPDFQLRQRQSTFSNSSTSLKFPLNYISGETNNYQEDFEIHIFVKLIYIIFKLQFSDTAPLVLEDHSWVTPANGEL